MTPGRIRRAASGRARALALLVGVVTLLAVPATANAALVNTVTGKETRLEVPWSTFVYLSGKHIHVYPQGEAMLSFEPGPRIFVTFPITGGSLVGNTNLGTINMAGSLAMTKSNEDYTDSIKRLRTSNPQIVNAQTVVASAYAWDGDPLLGNVGAPTPVMDIRNVSRTTNADGSIRLAGDWALNAVTATVLNTYFETDAFSAGMVIGRAVSTITTAKKL
jgi:hypothetical protein